MEREKGQDRWMNPFMMDDDRAGAEEQQGGQSKKDLPMDIMIVMQIVQTKGHTSTNTTNLCFGQGLLCGIQHIRDGSTYTKFHHNPKFIIHKEAILWMDSVCVGT